MKTNLYFLLFTLLLFASCSSLQQSAVNDDIYYSPKDEPAVSNIDYYNQSSNSMNKTAIVDRKNDKTISALLENESIENIDTVIYQSEDDYENPYESIVVDSYEESQQRRLEALRGSGMHNNYFITLSDDYWYAQAYFNDPFYNVVVYGNNIWVEPYWMSSWYSFGHSYYQPYYYNSFYYPYYSYNPYYSYYGNYGFYNPYYSYSSYSSNNNYVSSSFHSFRQRSLAGTSSMRSSLGRSSRDLPESYIGRDISGSSTVKSGVDRTSSRVAKTIRLRETNSGGSSASVRTTNRQTQTGTTSATNRNYTRPKQSTRSTYNSPTSTSSRYNRPASSSVSSGTSSTGVSRTSGSSTVRSGSSNSRSGSSYSPSRSTGSSGNSSVSRSSGNSGATRSSGSSTRSSGSSSRSSGSSSKSSGSSSRGGRR